MLYFPDNKMLGHSELSWSIGEILNWIKYCPWTGMCTYTLFSIIWNVKEAMDSAEIMLKGKKGRSGPEW